MRSKIIVLEGASQEELSKLEALLMGLNEPIFEHTTAFTEGSRKTMHCSSQYDTPLPEQWVGSDYYPEKTYFEKRRITIQDFLSTYGSEK